MQREGERKMTHITDSSQSGEYNNRLWFYNTVSQALGRGPFVGRENKFMGPLMFGFLHLVLYHFPQKE